MPHRDAGRRSKRKEAREARKTASKKSVCVLGPRNFLFSFFHLWALRISLAAFRPDHEDRIRLSLMREDTSKESSSILEKRLNGLPRREISRGHGLLFSSHLEKAIYLTFKTSLATMAFWRVLWMLPVLISSYWLFKLLVGYFARAGEASSANDAHLAAVGIFLCHLVSIAGYHKFAYTQLRTGVQCRAALIPLVYKKSIQSSITSRPHFEVGNLVSKDCNIVTEAVISSVNFWLAIPECVIISVVIIYEFGYFAVPAVALIFILCLPFQMLTSRSSCTLVLKENAAFVERSKILLEILTLIRMIKMYAWEEHYRKTLLDLTKRELHKIRVLIFIKSCELLPTFYAPLLCVLATVLTAAIVNPALITPLYVFTTMSLFSVLRYPLAHFPHSFRSMRVAKSSFEILDNYLSLDFGDAPLDKTPPPENDPSIVCELV